MQRPNGPSSREITVCIALHVRECESVYTHTRAHLQYLYEYTYAFGGELLQLLVAVVHGVLRAAQINRIALRADIRKCDGHLKQSRGMTVHMNVHYNGTSLYNNMKHLHIYI